MSKLPQVPLKEWANVATMTGPELVTEYNTLAAELGEKPLKRFESRAVGQMRVRAMRTKVMAKRNKDAAGGKKGPKRGPKIAESVRKSWLDPEVYAKRRKRWRVRVENRAGERTYYPSVPQAFRELGLPMQKHIKFRGQLIEAGELEALGYKWKIIERKI